MPSQKCGTSSQVWGSPGHGHTECLLKGVRVSVPSHKCGTLSRVWGSPGHGHAVPCGAEDGRGGGALSASEVCFCQRTAISGCPACISCRRSQQPNHSNLHNVRLQPTHQPTCSLLHRSRRASTRPTRQSRAPSRLRRQGGQGDDDCPGPSLVSGLSGFLPFCLPPLPARPEGCPALLALSLHLTCQPSQP